jgi:DNA-directed RNA polymerase subunit RPC12/RpoP
MEKRPYDNQVHRYCDKCGAWKLHTNGRKYYTCLTCSSRVPKERANTRLQADGLVACDHVFVPTPPHGYLHCKFCNSAAAKA